MDASQLELRTNAVRRDHAKRHAAASFGWGWVGMSNSKRKQSQSPTLVSLFAGAGGLDLGLEAAGFETVAANELEPYACETLRQNQLLSSLSSAEFQSWLKTQLDQRCYKGISPAGVRDLQRRLAPKVRHHYLQSAKILEGDIRAISSNAFLDGSVRRGELTLVAGGPPCQPFSRAGKRESVEVAEGRLFLEFVRVVSDLRPRWFLFENVKGLILTKTDVAYAACPHCQSRRIVSFETRCAGLDDERSKPVPCPQCSHKNARLAVDSVRGGTLEIVLNEFQRLGYHCHWTVLNSADFGAPQVRERLFIVGSRDNEPFSWPTPSHAGERAAGPLSQPQLSLFKQSVAPKMRPSWRTMLQTLWTRGHHPEFGVLDPDKAVLWVKNVVRPHDEPVTWRLDRPSPTIGAHQAAKLAIAPDGVPDEQLKRQQWHVLGRRQGDTPPVPVKHAYLSDSELLEIQTFPRHWYLHGTRMQRAFQIGNAVPPALGTAVGAALMTACGAAKLHPPARVPSHELVDRVGA